MEHQNWNIKLEYLKNTRNHFWNDDYFEFLVKNVWKINKPINIIDFGCGYGFLGIKLLPILPEGSTYTGVDIGVKLLEDATQLFSNSPYKTKFIEADLMEFSILEKYDLAICQAVLRHIPEYKMILEKMIDCVVNNGKVVCIEVNRRMENAGLYIAGIEHEMDFGVSDNNANKKWLKEVRGGGRDYLTGIKIPVLMEKLGLVDVGIRVNDFVEFVSPSQDKEKYSEHRDRFIEEHGLSVSQEEVSNIFALNARCLLISYGTKVNK